MTENAKRPRIAYARALQQAGADAVKFLCGEMASGESEASLQYDWSAPEPRVRDTDAMAMLSVAEGNAEFAIIPYIDDAGYNYAALIDLNSAFELVATKILCIQSHYCLAALADDITLSGQHERTPTISEIYAPKNAFALVEEELAGLTARGAQVSIVQTPSEASQALTQSPTGANAQAGAPIAVKAAILPRHVAKENSRFKILKENVTTSAKRQWFLVVKRARDETVYFDKYKTTRARARYFWRRMRRIADETPGACGVGVMLRFKRDGDAAATADVEAYLRAEGVRYDVFDLPPRHQSKAPPPRIMEIEFSRADLSPGISRPISGAAAALAMKIAFAKWKSRGIQLIGVMPITQFRLPAREPRRWWAEGAEAGLQSFMHTMFVRFSRVLFYAITILALAGAALFIALRF